VSETLVKDDAYFAKVFGWTWSIEKPEPGMTRPTWRDTKGEKLGTKYSANVLPCFTTSLDSIVAEIERRGIEFILQSAPTLRGKPKMYDANIIGEIISYEPTAPLALCEALEAYLEK